MAAGWKTSHRLRWTEVDSLAQSAMWFSPNSQGNHRISRVQHMPDCTQRIENNYRGGPRLTKSSLVRVIYLHSKKGNELRHSLSLETRRPVRVSLPMLEGLRPWTSVTDESRRWVLAVGKGSCDVHKGTHLLENQFHLFWNILSRNDDFVFGHISYKSYSAGRAV